MKPILYALLGLSLMAPLSAFAFLGMNAGASLQGALPSWTKQLGTRTKQAATYSNAVATDPSKNVIVVGYTTGDLDGNTLTGTQDALVTKYNSSGTKLWTREFGVAYESTRANGVTTDSSGNIFVTGYTTGGLDGNSLIGSPDCFLIKYDSSGTKQWTKTLGVASNQTYGTSVSLDPSGNILVAGYTSGGLDGNTLSGYRDFFVTKYDSSGAKQWTRQLGVPDISIGTYGSGVAADAAGNVFVTGYTYGGLDGKTLIGSEDTFVTKYNSSGVKQWTQALGVSSKSTQAQGVAVDPTGNVFVAGSTRGNLDGNTLSGVQGAFVTMYDTTGAKQWTKLIGTNVNGMAVATDSSGNIFLGGTTFGSIDGQTSVGLQDFFITKYDSTGAKLWTKELGPSTPALTSAYAYGIATDTSDNVAISGYTTGGVDGNTLSGTSDFFVSKYDSTGTKQWTRQLGSLGPGSTSAMAAATDTSGNLYIIGTTDSGIDGNAQTGSTDFFVTKYDSTGTKLWTRQLGVAQQIVFPQAAATDSSGNVFVAGFTNVGLDGNTLTGTYDFFVTKYNSTGTKVWTKQMGVASKNTKAYGVATDSSGNIYVAGSTNGALNGTLTGNTDFFVTKLDPTGAKLWGTQLGVASHNASASAVATDSSGNVFVAGNTDGGLDGNTVAGPQDFFVTEYDSTGTKVWTKQMGVASKSTQATGVATDSSGNVFVVGYTYGGIDSNTLTGLTDLFVTKYDATGTGTKLWTRLLGVASQDTRANAVATDSFGNIFVAGYTTGGLDGNAHAGTQDSFVTKYASAGVKQWTKQMGASQSTTKATGIAMDKAGHLYVVGSTTRGIDFVSQIGATDAFACQYVGN